MTPTAAPYDELKRSVEQAKADWHRSLDQLIRDLQQQPIAQATSKGKMAVHPPDAPSVVETTAAEKPFYAILDPPLIGSTQQETKTATSVTRSLTSSDTSRESTAEWVKKRFDQSAAVEAQRSRRRTHISSTTISAAPTPAPIIQQKTLSKKKYTLAEALNQYHPTEEDIRNWKDPRRSRRYALPGIPWDILTDQAQLEVRRSRQTATPSELRFQEQRVRSFAVGGEQESASEDYGENAEDVGGEEPELIPADDDEENDDNFKTGGGSGDVSDGYDGGYIHGHHHHNRHFYGGAPPAVASIPAVDAAAAAEVDVDVIYAVPEERVPSFPVQVQDWNRLPPPTSSEPIVPPELVQYYQEYLRQQFAAEREQLHDPNRGYGYHIQTTLPPIVVKPTDPSFSTLVSHSPPSLTTTTTTSPSYWEKPVTAPLRDFSRPTETAHLSSVPFRYTVQHFGN